MAACYDAIKAVNPGIDVIGFGFAPRGNDDATATSNVSESPIRFLEAIAAAYKASGRVTPIADDVSLHCYPNVNTDAPSVGFSWPNIGCVNLDRFKQAWWDVFRGTGQPVFREAGDPPGRYVHAYIDESGYQAQVPADHAGAYSGTENVPTVTDEQQGQYYAQLIAWAVCDPDVAELNFFHLIDESALTAMQTGLVLADGTHRASYEIVKTAIAANQQCHGAVDDWRHVTQVVGASVDFKKLARSFLVTAAEGYSFDVRIARGARTLSSRSGTGDPNVQLKFKLPKLRHGKYRMIVTLHAETNAIRVTTFQRSFHV
jgi:nucleoside 2-deoxyribosyltransferase